MCTEPRESLHSVFITLSSRQWPKPSSRKRNATNKLKWLSEKALQIAEKRWETKGKEEKERYTHLNAEFQGIARRDKKVFLSEQCKEIEENNRMGKTRNFYKKIRDIKEHFLQRWTQWMDLTETEDIKKKWQEYMEVLFNCVQLFATPWTVRLLCPWGFPGKNTGVDCHSLLQGIFPTQGSNLGFMHWRQILYCLSYHRSPRIHRRTVQKRS